MDIFGKFKQVLKIREVLVDNEVFQLHYRVTALLLLGCAALVASKQHFGDPIDCITRDDVPSKILDTYCWIHSTFTLPNSCNKTVGTDVPHPCVDKYASEDDVRTYHKYYQWVYFVLFFQALCFYAPHYVWKNLESKLLFKLTENFKDPLLKIQDQQEKTNQVVLYLSRTVSKHQSYLYYFVLCELWNFFNVIIQIRLVDEFLGGTFATYGLDVLEYFQSDEVMVDPMVRVFPRLTKCSFHRFGSSGDVQKYDALCILPLNIINEKIYLVMWFWFVTLAVITGIWMVYRFLTLTQPNVRLQVIKRRANLIRDEDLEDVLDRIKTGDWFLLSMMCKNMDSQWFRLLIVKLRYKLEEDESSQLDSEPSDDNDAESYEDELKRRDHEGVNGEDNKLMSGIEMGRPSRDSEA